jgi:hypothetical protein
MSDDLPFKVVRSNGTDEVLARAMNLMSAHRINLTGHSLRRSRVTKASKD